LGTILYAAGITTMLADLTTASLSKSQVGQTSLVSDVVDWQTLNPASNRSQTHFFARPVFSKLDDEKVKKLQESLGTKVHQKDSLFHCLGPSFPTRAEIAIAYKSGSSAITITSTSLFSSASGEGATVYGLSLPIFTYEKEVNEGIAGSSKKKAAASSDHKDKKTKSETSWFEERCSPVSTHSINNKKFLYALLRILKSDSKSKALTLVTFPTPTFQIGYDLPIIPSLDTTLLKDCVEQLKKNVKVMPKCAVISDLSFGKSISKIKLLNGLEFELIEVNKQTFIQSKPAYVYSGCTPLDVRLPIRILTTAGVKQLLLVGEFASVDDSIKVGDSLLIADHNNLSGRSPLFGHNDEDFGDRFPPMHDTYSMALRKTLKIAAKKEKIDLKEVVAVNFVGPLFTSPNTAKLGRLAGAQVATISLVPEVVVAHHANIRLAMLGYVTLDLQSGKSLSEEDKVMCRARVEKMMCTMLE